MTKRVKAKRPCCHSAPRCKRCPVVLLRLSKTGTAQRTGKRTYVVDGVGKKEIKSARKR